MEARTSLEVEVVPGPAGSALIRLSGELDVSTAGLVVTGGDQLVAAGQRDLVLDCEALRFCDSGGLHAILALNAAVQPDGSVTIARPQPQIERLLEITRVAERLTVRPDLPDLWAPT